MGQKVNPTGFRTGITEDWKSKWYAPKHAYGTFLVEDFKIRRLIDARLNRCFQLMETDDPSLFDEWIASWSDLGEFEVVPVIGSAEASERVLGSAP